VTGYCESLEALPIAAWEAEITPAGDVELFLVVTTNPGHLRRKIAPLEICMSRDEAKRLGETLVSRAEAWAPELRIDPQP